MGAGSKGTRATSSHTVRPRQGLFSERRRGRDGFPRSGQATGRAPAGPSEPRVPAKGVMASGVSLWDPHPLPSLWDGRWLITLGAWAASHSA